MSETRFVCFRPRYIFPVIYSTRKLIIRGVNRVALDRASIVTLSVQPHLYPGSRFVYFNSQYTTMIRDLLDIAQLIYNGETDIIILFPFPVRQSNQALLEGITGVFFGRSLSLKEKAERKENRQECDPCTSSFPRRTFLN
jgi:hypothetical protein